MIGLNIRITFDWLANGGKKEIIVKIYKLSIRSSYCVISFTKCPRQLQQELKFQGRAPRLTVS